MNALRALQCTRNGNFVKVCSIPYMQTTTRLFFSMRKGIRPTLSSPDYRRIRKPNSVRVCVVGAAGNVGSQVALLLKCSLIVDYLALYDVTDENTRVATELSHIDSNCRVYNYIRRHRLEEALKGSNVVVICASEERQPHHTVDDMFECNAGIVEDIATACTTVCPQACVLVVTQPVDSLTPLVGQVFRDAKLCPERQVIGVTSSNMMRATHILAETLGRYSDDFLVPVIGGHCEDTIVPLFSACCTTNNVTDVIDRQICESMLTPYRDNNPPDFMQNVIDNMVFLVKNWDDWVHGPTLSNHSAPISGALSAARTAANLIRTLKGLVPEIYDIAYVHTGIVPGVSYFTVPVKFGPNGVKQSFFLPVQTLTEQCMLRDAILSLIPKIMKGKKFAKNRYTERRSRYYF